MATVTEDVSTPDKFQALKVTFTTSIARVTSNVVNPRRGIQLKAGDANTGIIYIGGSNVSSSAGFPLAAGQGVFLPTADTAGLYAIGSASGQDLYYIIL